MAITPVDGDDEMTTTATPRQLFETLNTLRARNGKQPLKALKQSRAQLETMINAEVNAFEATAAELAAQSTRKEVVDAKTAATIEPKTDRADTSTDGTKKPELVAAQRAAREANEAKDASLAKLEAESPSPSAQKKLPNTHPAKRGEKNAPIKQKIAAKKTTTARAGFSAAQVIAEFGIAPKIGRALLRKHKVAKNAEAIRAFFKARAK
jgi:hypothetical protein